MSDQFVQVQPNSTGEKIDGTELAVGANTVFRQRMTISGVGAAELADVKSSVVTSGIGVIVRTLADTSFGGTTAPGLGIAVVGKTSDATPQYQLLPLTAGGVAVNVIDTNVTASQPRKMQDGAGNALTSNSTTTTSKFALDQNILSILGTAPTTPGFLDIKGADGNVFVRQATAANLNATVAQGAAATLTSGWPIVGSQTAETTAAWTSATATNTTLTLNVTGYSMAVITFNQGTTITGGAVTFEVSDTAGFTNAYPIQAAQPNTFAVNTTYTLQASTNQAFEIDVGGWAAVRVRLSTPITGTGTVNVGLAANAMASDPALTIGGSVTVSGTVTSNAGSGTFNISDLNAQTQGSTTSGQKGYLQLGAVTTAAPAYTTAQTSPLSLDTSGNLRTSVNNTVTVTGTVTTTPPANATTNLTQLNSVALGSPSNYGTSPGAVSVQGVNAFVTNTVTISGTVTSNIGTTNGLALDASVTGLQVAQGSTTSGQKGGLTLGAVTTAAPTYTTAQTSPLSLTTAGALRVDGSAATQPVSGTVTSNAGTGTFTVAGGLTNNNAVPGTNNVGALVALAGSAAPSYTNGDQVLLSVDTSGNLRVTGSFSGGGNQTSSSASGTLTYNTSNSAVTYSASGTFTGVSVQIISSSITGSPIVTFEASPDGTNWYAVYARRTSTGAWSQTYSAVNETALFQLATIEGMVQYRARVSTTGTAGTGATTIVLGNEGIDVPTYAAVSAVAVPPNIVYVGANKSGNLAGLSLDGSGNLNVNLAAGSGSGTFTTSDTNLVTQGSTTSGQKGPLVQGAVTTAAPTYTTAQTSPLSLTTAGALRVDGSAVTQPVNGTVTSNQGTAATVTAGWPIVGGAIAEATAAWTSATASNTTLQQNVQGYNSVMVTLNQGSTITGGVVTFEASDTTAFTNAYPVQAVQSNSFTAATTYTLQQSTNQAFEIDVGGFAAFRVRLSTVITGTGTVNVGIASQAMAADPSVVVGGTVTANAGTGTFTVSGTVTSNAGSGTFNTSDANAQSQGSATTGQKGFLEFGAVTTSAPTYTTGQSSPLSLDTSGNLRVIGSFSSGALVDLVGSAGTLNALNAAATINSFGYNAVGMFLAAGTLVGTIVPEASLDGGTTWISTFFDDPSTSTKVSSIVFGSSNTATTRTIVGVGGASNYRVRVSAFTSGTASCTLRADLINDPSTLHAGPAGSVQPPTISQVGGFVTTAAPTYTTSTLNALSLTTGGGVRIDLASVAGTTVVTSASGVAKVGISGNAAATLDATVAAGTAPTNALATLVQYNSTIPALTAAQTVAAQSDTTGSTYVNIEGRKATYSCFASFTPVAGDIAVLPGSASKTIRVTRVEVSLSTTGTAAIEAVQLVKRSAADTAGTSTAMTAVPHDSNFAAASAAPLSYTAAPTPGAAVGTVRGVQFNDGSASLPGSQTWLWTFGERPSSAIVLRGTAQELCVNLGAVVATQTATVSFEWTEE